MLAGLVAVIGLVGLGAWLVVGRPRAPAVAHVNLRVGVYDNAPKVFVDRDGRPAGLFVTLLDAMAQQEGWQLEYVRCEWADCLEQLADGRLDLMPDVAYTTERATRFDFHRMPVTYSWSQVYRRPGVRVNSLRDLAGLRVALLRGGMQQRALLDALGPMGKRATLLEADSYPEAFALARDGRADVVVSNNFFGRRSARAFGLEATPVLFSPASLYFAAGKGRHAGELQRIDASIERWQEDPRSIYFQAMSRALAPAPVVLMPRWVWPAAATGGTLLLALAVFALVLRWRVKRATADSEHARRQLEHVLEVSPVALFLAHQQGEELVPDWVSPNITRLYGFQLDCMMQPDWWRSHVHPDDRNALESAVGYLRHQPLLTREYRVRDGQGATRYIHERLQRLSGGKGAPLQVVVTWTDLSEARAHAAELSFVAHHDALTGLPNRQLLHLYVEDAVQRPGAALSVVVLDHNRLRNINDTLGHAIGDQALQAAAKRLTGILPEGGFLARLGGGEFVLVLPGGDEDRAAACAQAMLDACAQPLLVAEHPVVMTACAGIAIFPQDGEGADALLKHAELALYEAKRLGPGRYAFFEMAMSTGAVHRLAIENGLRLALVRGELRLHYQPQLDLRDGTLVGVEALVRWQHPEWGLLSPLEFVPIAEEIGLIDELGMWVLEAACRQLKAWDESGLRVPAVAVNCSVKQLDADQLPAQVAAVLASVGLAPDRVELEITESVLMRHPERAVAVLQALTASGVRLAIDDFGTGHSSLAYLKRLPRARLKIDRAFVSGIGNDPDDEQICRTVIALARNLQMQTLAEGVEQSHESDFLRAEGCDLVQGYLYGRPMAASDFEDWLATRAAAGQGG
ncbi:hypothetical protein GCM10028795_16950 [Lysobacter olei]